MLKTLLQKCILLLDGAMGTQLMAKGAKAPLEALNLSDAESVRAVHRAYLEAGADIITTNTICADSLSLGSYGLAEHSFDIALSGAKLAREVADEFSTSKPRFVAGSVGPTTRNLTLATDTDEMAVAEAYGRVVRGLVEGGVDMILLESAMDVKNIRLAVEQVRRVSADIPIAVSAVLSRLAGRVASGATVEKFLEQLPLGEIAILGFNCSGTPQMMESSLRLLCEKSDKPVIFYPSAGNPLLPVNQFAKQMEDVMRERRVNVVGGCCGTTPAHIKALARGVERWQPRHIKL